jgi:glutamine synthetase
VVVLIVGGTASHCHVSLKKSSASPDAGIAGVPGLNVLETEFIAGLLDHLQALAAFVMPTMASYERLMDGAWAVIPSQIN